MPECIGEEGACKSSLIWSSFSPLLVSCKTSLLLWTGSDNMLKDQHESTPCLFIGCLTFLTTATMIGGKRAGAGKKAIQMQAHLVCEGLSYPRTPPNPESALFVSHILPTIMTLVSVTKLSIVLSIRLQSGGLLIGSKSCGTRWDVLSKEALNSTEVCWKKLQPCTELQTHLFGNN